MATCRDCRYCEVHVGYWICCNDGVRRPRDLQKLRTEICSNFKK